MFRFTRTLIALGMLAFLAAPAAMAGEGGCTSHVVVGYQFSVTLVGIGTSVTSPGPLPRNLIPQGAIYGWNSDGVLTTADSEAACNASRATILGDFPAARKVTPCVPTTPIVVPDGATVQ